MKRPLLIAGNWKMHPETSREAEKIFAAIAKGAKQYRHIEVLLAPPFVYLSKCKPLARSKRLSLGAQDTFYEQSGSYTGEISPTMLKDCGVRYTIVGHSERRALGEDNEMVGRKVRAVLKCGLEVVLCIGESARDRGGEYLSTLRAQLIEGLSAVSKQQLSRVVVAYEPVWAIGKSAGEAMAPSDIHETALFVRKVLVEQFGKTSGLSVPVLYGGSVEGANAKAILSEGRIDGLLVGHASRVPKEFMSIMDAAEHYARERK